jgi:hypothetical protein
MPGHGVVGSRKDTSIDKHFSSLFMPSPKDTASRWVSPGVLYSATREAINLIVMNLQHKFSNIA